MKARLIAATTATILFSTFALIGGLGRSVSSRRTGSLVLSMAEGSPLDGQIASALASPLARKVSKQEADEFFRRLQAQNPHPKTELQYRNPYTLLVAVALSAQATDKSVNKATGSLFKI